MFPSNKAVLSFNVFGNEKMYLVIVNTGTISGSKGLSYICHGPNFPLPSHIPLNLKIRTLKNHQTYKYDLF